MCQDRINNLVDNFNNYLNIFSERNQLCGPSIYFHNRIMGILRETTLSSLQNQLWFSEYIYAVLVSWGMHRMDRGAQLKDFPVFHSVITNFIQNLIPISHLSITELTENNITSIINLFEENSVMHSIPKLAGNSKALHHILPNIIPPIDGNYTIKFFNLRNRRRGQGNNAKMIDESNNFEFIIKKYQHIINTINWNEIHYNGEMNATRIKLVDNAIIGYRLEQKAAEKSK